VSGAPRRLRRADGSPYGTRLPLSDRLRASRNAPRGLSLGTSSERAGRARVDDRNRGRKRARTGARGRTSLDRPERGRADPSPTGTSIGACAPLRGRRAADARRHAIGVLDFGVPPEAPCSSSTSSRRPVEVGATTRSACRLHGLLPACRKGHVSGGTRDGRTLPRRTRLARHACSSSRTGRLAGAGPDARVSSEHARGGRALARSHPGETDRRFPRKRESDRSDRLAPAQAKMQLRQPWWNVGRRGWMPRPPMRIRL
jgi:hypothetical protein